MKDHANAGENYKWFLFNFEVKEKLIKSIEINQEVGS